MRVERKAENPRTFLNESERMRVKKFEVEKIGTNL